MAVLFLVALLAFSNTNAAPRSASRGPAYDYIYRHDPNYSWEVIGQVEQEGFTTYFLNMTSQQWFDEELTNQPIWFHNVYVHVPDEVSHSGAGALYISSRNNRNLPNENREHVRRIGRMAVDRGIVTGVVEMIPNQPMIFENDGIERNEDAIIAYTWLSYLEMSREGLDPPAELLMHLPMAKGSVRAMDAMSEFVQTRGMEEINKFFVSGQSKRGWTTWLVGAVDERVVAMAPTVLSCLNIQENFHHYYRSFGGWPFALFDYWILGLMGMIDDPEMPGFQRVTDPYFYRQWMTMPKLIINGASDEFFLLDDFDYFYDDLPGEKHIWIMEDHGHSIGGPLQEDYWAMLGTFFISVLEERERPTFEYWRNTTETGGSITVRSSVTPLEINALSAPSVVSWRRDFRKRQLGLGGVEDTGIVWNKSGVEDLGDGMYRVRFDNPEDGYFAFFVKLTYAAFDGHVYILTTKAHILPEGFPYEDCVGEECQGIVV